MAFSIARIFMNVRLLMPSDNGDLELTKPSILLSGGGSSAISV